MAPWMGKMATRLELFQHRGLEELQRGRCQELSHGVEPLRVDPAKAAAPKNRRGLQNSSPSFFQVTSLESLSNPL